VDWKDKMFLLHLGAPEKEHLILQEHLSGEGKSYPSGAPKWRKTSYPSGAPKWRRNILSFQST
jgi:hypothetical protein